MINRSDYLRLLRTHNQSNWNSRGIEVGFSSGPVEQLPDGFEVVRHPPSAQRGAWTYATVGMSTLALDGALELHVLIQQRDDRAVTEALYAVAHYHHTGRALGLHDIVNIGRPWVPGSACEYGFISLPYLDGPPLEWLELDGGLKIRCLWLIPITNEERVLASEYGVEALETRFESAAFPFADLRRASTL